MGIGNVPSRSFTPQGGGNYPAMLWNPKTGDMRVYASGADVPEGWLGYNPKDVAAAAKAAPAAPAAPATPAAPVVKLNMAAPRSMGAPAQPPPPGQQAGAVMPPRANIVAELQKRNLKFNAQSPTKALYDLLHGYIEANES